MRFLQRREITPVYSKSDQGTALEKTGDLVMKQSHNGQRFVVFALENQEEIDYGMPARIMLQEALEYDRQMREIRRENQRIYKELYERNNRGKGGAFYKDSGEYLYRMRREDYLCPVMTLVVYWGEKEWRGAKSLHEMMNFANMDLHMQKELKKMIPEYPLHFMNVSDFEHFEYFRTEVRPLLELFQRRNRKEEFISYMQEDESCLKMDDESWHVLGQMTDSKAIQSIITQKNRRERSVKGMCKAIDDLINDGKAEGKAEAIIMFLEEYGIVSEELKTKIMKQTDLQVLDEWFKLAIHTKEVDEFVRQSQKLV